MFSRKRKQSDFNDEVEAHIALEADRLKEQGLSEEEAQAAARRAFGNVTQAQERFYESNRWSWWDELRQDLSYGLRQLRRNPGFAVLAVFTLALGIGANTAMFSVVYGVLLRPLPYPHPKRIVQISLTYRGGLESYSGFYASGFDFWREHHQPFQYLAASTGVGFNLTGVGRPERINALRVSTQFFGVYGVQPFLGRSFSTSEDRVGGPNVSVLSYDLWKSRFNGDRDVIGHTILLDGAPFNVIGVMPAGFETIPPVALWTTIGQVRSTIGSGQNYHVIGRLEPSVSVQQASSYLAGLAQPFFATPAYIRWVQASDRKALSVVAEPYRYVIAKNVRTPLLVLFGAIGLVLLIACANVANLLLSRAAARSQEITLRTALGAGRSRIVRQLLTESLLVAGMGAALGILMAYCGLIPLLSLAPEVLPRAQHVGLNGWALFFAAGVAILAGLLSGLAPALTASHTSLSQSLKEGVRGSGLGVQRGRLSAGVVSAEAALSLILLIGCGLLVRTFANLLSTDPGFNAHRLLTLQISTKGSQYKSMPALASYYHALVTGIQAVPGVRSAAIVAAGSPLEGGGNVNPEVRVGGELKRPSVDYREITPGFFRALGVPLLAGTAFTEADSTNSPKVTIINKAFANRYFHDQNPVGRHFVLWRHDLEVIGVAGDVRSSLNEPAPPTFFVPMTQASFAGDKLFQGWFPTSILVRTSVKPLSLSRAVESAVRDVNPNIPVSHIRSMEQIFALSLARQRLSMTLMSLFAALALLLAAVGLYGVISYSVTQRTHEIGIRMALGAERGDVLKMVVRQGMKVAIIGVAIGSAGALALTRFLASLLYGVKPTDPLTFIAVSLILIAVALLACYIPARRAAKVDPMVALRYE